jgi:hypothetical protein
MPRNSLRVEKADKAIQSSYTESMFNRLERHARAHRIQRLSTLQEVAVFQYMEGSLGELPAPRKHSRLPSFLSKRLSALPLSEQAWAGVEIAAGMRGLEPEVWLAREIMRSLVGREVRHVPEFEDSGFDPAALADLVDTSEPAPAPARLDLQLHGLGG